MDSYQTATPYSASVPATPDPNFYSNESATRGDSNMQSTVFSPAPFSERLPAQAQDPKLALRAVEALCALISFSCATATFAAQEIAARQFLIFVGVTAFIFDLLFIIVYLRGDSLPASWQAKTPVIDLAITALWTFFWFAGAIAYAVKLTEFKHNFPGYSASAFNAAATFAFFSFFLWSSSAFLAYKRFRGDVGSSPMTYSDL